MKVNSKIPKRHFTPQEKVAHLCRRIFKLGYENMRIQTFPIAPGGQAPLHWSEDEIRKEQAVMLNTHRIANLLTRRLQRLI